MVIDIRVQTLEFSIPKSKFKGWKDHILIYEVNDSILLEHNCIFVKHYFKIRWKLDLKY